MSPEANTLRKRLLNNHREHSTTEISRKIYIKIKIMKKGLNKRVTYYNKYDRHKYQSQGERSTEPSQTIEGESYTMAELIRMSVTGEIPQMAKAAFSYDPDGTSLDDDISERNITDLTDTTEIIEKQIQLETETIEKIEKIKSEQEKKSAEKEEKLEDKSEQSEGAESSNSTISKTAE